MRSVEYRWREQSGDDIFFVPYIMKAFIGNSKSFFEDAIIIKVNLKLEPIIILTFYCDNENWSIDIMKLQETSTLGKS